MSFRDLESCPKGGGHASKQQPKQRRDEESAFERTIKANIQGMQESVRKASEVLEHTQRTVLSRRMRESLDGLLEQSRDLSQETEEQFRAWTVHLAGEPTERHRKRFSYEKLQKAFEQEVMHLRDAAQRAIAVQQGALRANGHSTGSTSLECREVCSDDAEHGLLDDNECFQSCQLASLQEDAAIRNRIAQERAEGISRIHTQVSEVNQIIRDLASIVSSQGQQFETVESQAETASSNTKQAVQELKKAVDRQRGTRERLCCMLSLALLVLCFVVLPYMHALGLHLAIGSGTGAAGNAAAAGASLPLQPLDGSVPVVVSRIGPPLT